MIAVTTMLAVVLVSLLVTRVATISLTATGMPKEAARFQARSAFTGVGFTTKESEQLVNHPVRRRIVMVLMLVGNAGVVAVLGSAVVGLAGDYTGSQMLVRVAIALGGLAILWILSRSDAVDRRLSALVAAFLKKRYGMDVADHAPLLVIAGDWMVGEVFVREGGWLAERTVAELRLRDEGVTILGIASTDGGYVAWPAPDRRLEAGDALIVYGRSARVAEIDARTGGAGGDQAHAEAAAEHKPGEESSAGPPDLRNEGSL